MAVIRPIEIHGCWRQGYVLDFHTTGTACIGADEYGNPLFETGRTEIGELLYRLKHDLDVSVLPELAQRIAALISVWNIGFEAIIPVPPAHTANHLHPVMALAEEISRQFGVALIRNGICKIKETSELIHVYGYEERLRFLENAYSVESSPVAGKKILLFDDLYRSGATMNAIASALYDRGKVADVFAFAVTRTRSEL